MKVSQLKELLADYPDDQEFHWTVYWTKDEGDAEAEPVFPGEMIREMSLALFPVEEDQQDAGSV